MLPISHVIQRVNPDTALLRDVSRISLSSITTQIHMTHTVAQTPLKVSIVYDEDVKVC